MAKQVHIHIHRNKTRDAGEGEGKGKWITLSPSGTHVKVDGSGEITAGPKGMAGKKPSELSKSKASGSAKKEAPAKNSPGAGTPSGKADPVKQAREFEEHASRLQQQAQAEYTKNGKTDEYMRLRNEAQQAMNKGTDLMAQAVGASKRPAVNASSLKEGQALYDSYGQKVDEVESIQRRTMGKGLTINTRAGYQVHIDENGSNSQGWSNEKPGAAPSSGGQSVARTSEELRDLSRDIAIYGSHVDFPDMASKRAYSAAVRGFRTASDLRASGDEAGAAKHEEAAQRAYEKIKPEIDKVASRVSKSGGVYNFSPTR
jgi:hypothetical protein